MFTDSPHAQLQAGAHRSPAQEAASAAERHRQLHLITATRTQHGLSARRMLRQKYGAPGLVQRMHRMQAEVAEPMKPWEIAKAGQEVSLNQSRLPARHMSKPWVAGVTPWAAEQAVDSTAAGYQPSRWLVNIIPSRHLSQLPCPDAGYLSMLLDPLGGPGSLTCPAASSSCRDPLTTFACSAVCGGPSGHGGRATVHP